MILSLSLPKMNFSSKEDAACLGKNVVTHRLEQENTFFFTNLFPIELNYREITFEVTEGFQNPKLKYGKENFLKHRKTLEITKPPHKTMTSANSANNHENGKINPTKITSHLRL